jgi:hypothetical protein
MVKKNIEVISKSSKVGRWLGRIEVARKVHKEKFEDNAKLWRDFYEGNHFPEISNKNDLIVINYTYSILKAILPQIYFQDPYIYLSASEEKALGNRQLAEDSLNDTWREIKVKRQMKRIILDMLVMGYGVGKEGYWFETVRPERLETQAEFTEFVKEEYPYFLRQSPFDVVFDFEAKSLDEIRWLAARYYVPLDELKEKYPKEAKRFKGNYMAGDEDVKDLTLSGLDKTEVQNDLKRVEVWEISDLVDRKIHVVTEESKDEFLDSFDNPYDKLTSNWKLLFVNEIPDKLYPMSDVSILKDINLWMDKVNSMLMTDVMKSQRKILYEEDAFADEEEYQKFLSGEDLQMIKLSPGAIKENKILVVNASIIPQDFYNNNELCKDHLDNVSGVGSNQRGVGDNVDRRTAFEAGVMDRNAQLRNSERLDSITDFCISVAHDLLILMQEYGSKDTEFFTEKRGFQTWNKKKISGRFKPRIDIGSTVRRNSEGERQFMTQFGTQILEAVDDNGVPIVDKGRFVKLILKKFNVSIEDIDEVLLSNEEFLQKVADSVEIQKAIAIIQGQMQQPAQQPMEQPMPEQPMGPPPMEPPPMDMQGPQEGIELTPEEQALLQGG